MKKAQKKNTPFSHLLTACAFTALTLSLGGIGIATVKADETCQSPYMAKIVGQEDFVYIWTLGAEGIGDEQDKLVTVDVNPKSPKYGKVIISFKSYFLMTHDHSY